jgi:acyl-CoA synthetase (AMP-forming)/AMP-acid ligase II
VTARDPSGANIAGLLRDVALESPARRALLRLDGSVAWTFGALAEAAAARAARLTGLGVRPSARIVVLAPSGEVAVALAAAVLWSGATLLVPPRRPNLRAALRAVAALGPDAVIASAPLWAIAALEPGFRRVPLRMVTGRVSLPGLIALDGRHEGPATRRPLMAPAPRRPEDPAVVTFTTGTTGDPRPIVRTHAVLRGQHDALDRLRPARPDDVDLAGLPMLALHDLGRGVVAVLPPRGDPTASRTAASIREVLGKGITTVGGFPALCEALVRDTPAGAFPGLRTIHVGGAPVPVDLVRRLRACAPQATITIVYGATEAEPIAAIDSADYLAAAGRADPGSGTCVGAAVPGLEVRIAAQSDQSSAGVGPLQVRGAQVAAVGDESDDAGWLDVGDLARQDAEGRLWLLGRAAHAVGGIAPAGIEQVVQTVAGVRGAAVMNVEVAGRVRSVLAVEALPGERGALAARIEVVAAERHWPPLEIAVIARLPRDPQSGTKIDYRRLAALVRRQGPAAY